MKRRWWWLLVLVLALCLVFWRDEAKEAVTKATSPVPGSLPVPNGKQQRPGAAHPGGLGAPEKPEEAPVVAPPPPATAEAVQMIVSQNTDTVAACFRVINPESPPAFVNMLGEIGSLAQHHNGPRGYATEVEVELPDGSLASPSVVHCFTAAANAKGYETPTSGPVSFEFRVDLPPSAP